MERGLAHARVLIVVLLLAAALALAAVTASGCGDAGGAVTEGGGGGETAIAEPGANGADDGGAGGGSSGGATPAKSPKATKSPASKPSPKASVPPALRVVFVDVGQGDAAVLRSGAWTGLVDGGPSSSQAAVEAALARLGVRRLDTLVISHLHADHTGGLPALVRRYRPRRAWVAGTVTGSLAAALRGAGTAVVQVRRGISARFGRAKASVLAPGDLSGDANTDSVVLLLQAGGRRVVFTGDSTGGGEAAAGAKLARGPPVDVLKVSHHGSRSSTTASFVGDARPRVAIISVGPNSYGHPTNETVQRLRSRGTRVFSTQKGGSITLTVTGKGALRWGFSRSSAPLVRGVSGGSGGSSSSGGSGGGSAASTSTGAASGAAGGARVFITETGECYHRSGCRYLSHSRITITVAHAKADGYRPCSVCDPPG